MARAAIVVRSWTPELTMRRQAPESVSSSAEQSATAHAVVALHAVQSLGDLLAELHIEIDPELYEMALVHRSYSYEHDRVPHNERLEFLGDAVLGVIVAEHLYLAYPDEAEGTLAKLRSAVVSAASLAEVARDLQVGSLIKLGHGEILTGGDDKTSILADTMEALIGAIYLSQGMQKVEDFVHHLFVPRIEYATQLGAGLDWKTSLQEVLSELGLPSVSYEISESGPDHDKEFEAYAVVEDRRFGPGKGRSKKQAELQAAEQAFLALHEEIAETEDALHA